LFSKIDYPYLSNFLLKWINLQGQDLKFITNKMLLKSMASLPQGLGLFHGKNNPEEKLKKNIIKKREELDKNIKALLKEFKKTDKKIGLAYLDDKKTIEKLWKITRKTHIKIIEYEKLIKKLQHINNSREYYTTIDLLKNYIASLDWMLKDVMDKKEDFRIFIDQEMAKTIRSKLNGINKLWKEHLNEYRDKKH